MRISHILIATVGLLIIPLLAMAFTKEVNWDWFDFAIAGLLLAGTGMLFKLVIHKFHSTKQRIAAGIVLAAGLALIWAELAVGIFD